MWVEKRQLVKETERDGRERAEEQAMLTENLKNIPAGAKSKTGEDMWFSP